MNVKIFRHLGLWCLVSLGLFLITVSRPYAAATASGTPTAAATADVYWPTDGWRTSSPEAQGMDSQKLAQMIEAIKQESLDLDSLLVIRNGYMVSEHYFSYYNEAMQHELYSCTKSFTATLVGIAIDQGYIDNIDHRVTDYFPDESFENQDTRKQAMTLDNLLTMTSGLDWDEGDATYSAMYRSADWVKYVLDKPMKEAPGSQFVYCSGCSHILSAIVQHVTPSGVREFAKNHLFDPLGITNFTWGGDASGIPIGGWGLRITPRDMAKLGYLYLHHGQWDGQQIVSEAWAKAATEQHTTTDGDFGYGYQWWTVPSLNGYSALGRFGQTIFVAPDLNLIVVTTAPSLEDHDPIFMLIESYIVPSIL